MNSSSAVILSYYYRIFHKMLYLGKLAVLGLFLLVSADIFAVANMSASCHWLLLSSQCIWHPTAAKAFVSALQSKLLSQTVFVIQSSGSLKAQWQIAAVASILSVKIFPSQSLSHTIPNPYNLFSYFTSALTVSELR